MLISNWDSLFTDKVRRLYDKTRPVLKLLVDKKQADSVLVVTATLCVHGEIDAGACQIWTLRYPSIVNKIVNQQSVVYGQTEGYLNNSGNSRNLVCSCVIEDHKYLGQQELLLNWNANITPFLVMNPNKTDHANFGDCQTCSVIRVEEIIQQKVLPQIYEGAKKTTIKELN